MRTSIHGILLLKQTFYENKLLRFGKTRTFCRKKLLRLTIDLTFCRNKLLRIFQKPQKLQKFFPQTLSSIKVFKLYFIFVEFLVKILPVSVVPINKSTSFFYKQHFYRQHQAEICNKTRKATKQHPEDELLLFEYYFLSSCTISSKSRSNSKECVIRRGCLFLRLMVNWNENENEKQFT